MARAYAYLLRDVAYKSLDDAKDTHICDHLRILIEETLDDAGIEFDAHKHWYGYFRNEEKEDEST